MARLKQLVVDCRHPSSLARFWAAALDEFDIRPYDDEEVARLAEAGLTPETDPGVIVDGPALELCFQQVEVVETPKKPLHLDLAAEDREAEVARLVSRGASVKSSSIPANATASTTCRSAVTRFTSTSPTAI